jgi:hypothetical protein
MREYIVPALFLLFLPGATGQNSAPAPPATPAIPAGWKAIKDGKSACQIAVPSEWVAFSEGSGAAIFHDASTAIAAVTSQPGQAFKALSDSMVKLLDISREKMFENTVKRIFYQDKTSRNADDPHAYSASVPAKGGTCSCHVVFLPSVTEEVARKIVLSLGPAPE